MVPSKLSPPLPSNVLIGGPSLSDVAKQTAIDALNQGASAVDAAQKTKTAENAYRSAKNAGYSEERAQNRAQAAVKRSELSDEELKDLAVRERKLTERIKDGDGRPGASTIKIADINDPASPHYDSRGINIGTEENPDWVKIIEVNEGDWGYQSVLFDDSAHSEGHYPLVFRATESDYTKTLAPYEFAKDWIQNGLQQFGFVPTQYDQAAIDTNRYMRSENSNYAHIILVGHSLGGGLASYTGGLNGLPVVTFNSAGLGAGTNGDIINTGNAVDVTQYENYNVENDILTHYFNPYVAHPPVGDTHVFPKKPGDSGYTSHGNQQLGDAMTKPEIPRQ